MEREPVSVLIVDDLPSFRAAAAATVTATDGFKVAGVADSGEAALVLLRSIRAELVLMDVNMPGMDGFMATAEIQARYPNVEIVLLSVSTSTHLHSTALRYGARFVSKATFGPDVLEALWTTRKAPPTVARRPEPHDDS